MEQALAAAARNALVEARDVLDGFLADAENTRRIGVVARLLAERFGAGSKVMICGNGGSSCDAAHFAEELTGRFRSPPKGVADRPPLPALACTDAGHITCTANDYGYDAVFSRWVRALGRPGDVLIALSTSGNSANVVGAVAAARELDMHTVALLGKDGGALAGRCAHEWVVRGREERPLQADRIQEVHMLVLHTLIECVERIMYPALYEQK